MATSGEIWRPSVGRINGRLWGESHGRRHTNNTASHIEMIAKPPHSSLACSQEEDSRDVGMG